MYKETVTRSSLSKHRLMIACLRVALGATTYNIKRVDMIEYAQHSTSQKYYIVNSHLCQDCCDRGFAVLRGILEKGFSEDTSRSGRGGYPCTLHEVTYPIANIG